jgi:hypothetical protein
MINKDKTTPENTQSEYKSMILGLVSKNEELLNYANEELSKGFKFTANEILARIESNMSTISYYEQMIQVLTIGESTQYYTGNRFN